MGDTAAAQVLYKHAAEEYDRQNAAEREETNQLGEYLKSRWAEGENVCETICHRSN